MMNRHAACTNRLFCLGLLAVALVVSIGATPLLASSLPRAQGPQALSRFSYFPADTGNRWVYAVRGPGSASQTWEVKVTGQESATAFRSYFQLSGYFGGKNLRLVRTNLLGTVLERGDNGKDYLWYQFGTRVGKSWTMELAPGDNPICEDGATLTVGARDEVVTVPAGEFKHVIRIDFVTKCSDAGITHEWFAPGVGLIRREQTSIAGPVISELVFAQIGARSFPVSVYATTLQVSRSSYVNNLMPPVDPPTLPRVNGAFVVRDETDEPGELTFPSACRGLLLELRNQEGDIVLSIDTLEGVACPAAITKVELGKEALVVPFSFTLKDKDGKPLPDGAYSLTAVLQTAAAHDTLRPAARAFIQVKSVQ